VDYRHLAVMILGAAYLLMPPVEGFNNQDRINFTAPLSKWVELRRFNSESECDAALAVYRQRPVGGLRVMIGGRSQAEAAMQAAKCVSTDDPRLKMN
jgi:hypothetical protein